MKHGRGRPAVIAAAIVAIGLFTGAVVFAADFVYAMFVLGAWTPSYWLDRAHISRQTSTADRELGFVRKPGLFWKGSSEGREIVL